MIESEVGARSDRIRRNQRSESEVVAHSDRIGRNQSDRVRSGSSFGHMREKSKIQSPMLEFAHIY